MFDTTVMALKALITSVFLFAIIYYVIRYLRTERDISISFPVLLAIFCGVFAVWAFPELIDTIRHWSFGVYPSSGARDISAGGLNIQTMSATYTIFWSKVAGALIGAFIGIFVYSRFNPYS
ncbi:Uncharacterised protein [Yersinia pseudotuberculosis]|uniref:hypothetical protein n=1 Tax=Yersinia pseudotuberculosis TaxID=633 RepID=UPI000E000489|nr:hypothetical protein [Yersinia pseudotuberculosis]SUQ17630.1 Uncharacterised protein [Yersinia pseudotuberculosis]